LLEDIAIDKPPVGAAELIVIVPVEGLPPVTEVGFKVSDLTVGADTPNAAVLAVEPPAEALIVGPWLTATATVVMVKVAVVEPAATVTVAGTEADTLFEVSDTLWPPVGAAELMVTVPVEEDPPTTTVGFRVSDETRIGLIVRVADWLEPLELAVIEGVEVLATEPVVIVTEPVVAPAAIVAVAGPVTPLPVELSATVRPPAGAAEEIVTVPVVLKPPSTVVGLREKPVTVGPLTVSDPVAEEELAEPVMVAVVFVPTATVVAVNVTEVAPAGTVAVAGTVTAELLELRATG